MRRFVPAIALAVAALSWGQAQATVVNVYSDASLGDGIKSIDFVQVDKGALLPGYTTWDITVDFEGQLLSSQILTALTPGSIYQDAAGTNKAPQQLFVGLIPTLAYDTFVAMGGPTLETGAGAYSTTGGAVDLGGNATAVFDANQLNQNWFPDAGVSIIGGDDFLVARLTLSDSAEGSLSFTTAAGTAANRVFVFDVPVVGGQVVPEPTSLALLSLVGVALVGRRRARA